LVKSGGKVKWVEAVVGVEPVSHNAEPGLVIGLAAGMRVEIREVNQARLAGVMLREMLSGAKPC
jgi:hypothetical protein